MNEQVFPLVRPYSTATCRLPRYPTVEVYWCSLKGWVLAGLFVLIDWSREQFSIECCPRFIIVFPRPRLCGWLSFQLLNACMAIALCDIGILFLALKCFLVSVGAIVLGFCCVCRWSVWKLQQMPPLICCNFQAVLPPLRDKCFVCCMHDGQWLAVMHWAWNSV